MNRFPSIIETTEKGKAIPFSDIRRSAGNTYVVQSQSDPLQQYEVWPLTERCTCDAFRFGTTRPCKHIIAVQLFMAAQVPTERDAFRKEFNAFLENIARIPQHDDLHDFAAAMGTDPSDPNGKND